MGCCHGKKKNMEIDLYDNSEFVCKNYDYVYLCTKYNSKEQILARIMKLEKIIQAYFQKDILKNDEFFSLIESGYEIERLSNHYFFCLKSKRKNIEMFIQLRCKHMAAIQKHYKLTLSKISQEVIDMSRLTENVRSNIGNQNTYINSLKEKDEEIRSLEKIIQLSKCKTPEEENITYKNSSDDENHFGNGNGTEPLLLSGY